MLQLIIAATLIAMAIMYFLTNRKQIMKEGKKTVAEGKAKAETVAEEIKSKNSK